MSNSTNQTSTKRKVGITEVAFRDAHQSLLATRFRLDDMLPIAEEVDKMGFWSIESWGGATFDSCIRFLGEDPWERIRELSKAMPNTPQQMLLRGQNLLGYRHYADDVVRKFVDRCATNGVTVFRIFDAMNDMRNLKTAIDQTIKVDKHAQGTISYTVSPVHNEQLWVDLARQIEDMGAHSLCIKDMAGLLQPYIAYDLVKKLKQAISIPIQLHCHATTGLSTATLLKAIEAGVDRVDTATAALSMTYGHTSTSAMVSILDHSPWATGLSMENLEKINTYFRPIREKYAKFEGSLRGVDSRILLSQVPGGMLTNMENQLKEQKALDKMDLVLEEIPRVREELGYIPLVTPTSQIVGTQAVINVLTGERYKSITKEVAGILKGEYGATLAPVDEKLQQRVLEGGEAITCRPADKLEPEMATLEGEFDGLVKEHNLQIAKDKIDDVLTYALFPQVGLKFLQNRNNPDFFEPVPSAKQAQEEAMVKDQGVYQVNVNGQNYQVSVSTGGDLTSITSASATTNQPAPVQAENAPPSSGKQEEIKAPLSGNVWKIHTAVGQKVSKGDVLIILEAMKMETEIRSAIDGVVTNINIREGDSIEVEQPILSIAI
jgi:oxaloacetate decarboxylase alpha subunit